MDAVDTCPSETDPQKGPFIFGVPPVCWALLGLGTQWYVEETNPDGGEQNKACELGRVLEGGATLKEQKG